MFHDGSLQSGISLAIQEQKLVACFVRDDSEESSTWEDEWLQSGWVANLLAQKAVLLRLEAGSTEAGFLSAFCPLSQIPTLVVIQNGQLREQIVRGVSKEEFINRARKVLGAQPIPGTAVNTASSSVPEARSTSTPAEDIAPEEPETPSPAPAPQSQYQAPPIPPLSANAKGKQKATPPDTKSSKSSSNAAQQSARDALRKKKQDEKEELARIQARIAADKAGRRAEAERRKAERENERQEESSTVQPQARTSTAKKGSQAKDVHLNVRLFDGRTVRHVFPRDCKLQDDVRPWIDQEFAASAEHSEEKHPPYYFKQILAPLPSRELSAGEESETLGDIDLAPSATLVLIPVKGYTEAYSGNGGGGIVGGAVSGVTGLVGGAFGLASSAVGYVGSTLGSIVGVGSSTTTEEQHQAAEGRRLNEQAPNTTGIRVRTLADQREREPRNEQLYNGNQLNFEPNDDNSDRRS